MEACNGAHEKARRIADLGHDARLVNAADVKAVRNTRHKNDRRAQQDRQLLIREYKGYQRIRIELGNRIHSALEQYGIPTRQGMQRLACHLTEYLDERAEKITPTLRETVLRLFESWKRALADEEAAKRRLEAQAARDADAKRLMTIPGIGAIIALYMQAHALYMQAHIGNPHRFKNSRQAAASIRKKYGVIICAIASKLARICWRILRDRTVYQPNWQAAHSV